MSVDKYQIYNADHAEQSLGVTEDYHIISDPPYDGDYGNFPYAPDGMTTIYFSYLRDIQKDADEHHVWIKPVSPKSMKKKCLDCAEAINIWRSTCNVADMHWGATSNVHNDRFESKLVHEWQKPLSLMRRLICLYTNHDDLVIDPFMGSGTTVLAAVLEGRRAIGIEKCPERFAVAKMRLEMELYHE